jgi:ATP-dependent helicase/nuclease subunit B
MDYKTEPLATTKERIKQPFEDTQLAFYAALMPQEVRAAYVNVAEKDGTVLVEQTALNEVREALLLGIDTDFQRMKDGAPMLALGEGKACQFCAARGLCRKDSWAGVQDGEDNQV